MQFEYMNLSEERKEELKNMNIQNTYTGTTYESFDFKVSVNLEQEYILFMMEPEGEERSRRYVFVRGDRYDVVEIPKDCISRQEFVHDYKPEGKKKIRRYVFEQGGWHDMVETPESGTDAGEFGHDGKREEEIKECRHIYEEIRIEKSAITDDADKFVRALAVYNAQHKQEEDIVRSILYYDNELKIKEFCYDADNRAIDVVFERAILSKERQKEINALQIPYPYVCAGVPIVDVRNAYVYKSADEKYVLETVSVEALLMREINPNEIVGPNYCFIVDKKHYFVRKVNETINAKITKPYIWNTVARIEHIEGISEEEVSILAYAILARGREDDTKYYYESQRINMYYDDKLLIKEF